MNDIYVEFVEIPDGTPQEMMQFVTDRLNQAHAESRRGMSKRYGEFVDYSCCNDWKYEFKGTHFLVMEWRVTKFQSKEEFLGVEDDADDL